MSHEHAPPEFGRAFVIGIVLNLAFVAIEAFYGWRAGSLSLLGDAGHNLSDVGGLLLAWGGLAAGRLRADDRHTYGWRRASIMASFANALILLIAMGALLLESMQRLRTPVPMHGGVVMLVAGVGVLINAVTAALFLSGRRSDLNIRGAFMHMAADALVSIGVVLAGALYLWQGWEWIDPVMSMLIAAMIVAGTWSLFRQSLHLLFDGVPEHIDLPQVRQSLLALPDVVALHDLHVWAMGTSQTALSVHLVVSRVRPVGDGMLRLAIDLLHERFEITHATVQIETEGGPDACPSLTCD